MDKCFVRESYAEILSFELSFIKDNWPRAPRTDFHAFLRKLTMKTAGFRNHPSKFGSVLEEKEKDRGIEDMISSYLHTGKNA